jgi:class 3 adenylate cyclase
MSDIRGYTTIAEHADPAGLARQLNIHRAEMNHAIIDSGGTVMQFVEDGETVLSEATHKALLKPLDVLELEPQTVKGRDAPVRAYKLAVL